MSLGGVTARGASGSRFILAIGAIGLVAVVAIVFSSAARLPLVADDYGYLATVQQAGWWHSGQVWNVGGSLFRPILYLWFGLLHALFGLHPVPFHIASGLIVITAGVLTGAVARRLGLRGGAYAAIVFYCLHAAMTTPIGWASAANSPLAVALALCALYWMLRPQLRPIDVAGACAVFAVALITREVVTVTPAILVVTRYLVEGGRPPRQRLKRSFVVSLPLWLVLVAYLGLRRLSGFDGSTGDYTQTVGMHGLTNLGRLIQIATDLEPFSRPGLYSAVVIFLWAVLIGLCAMAALRSQRCQGVAGLTWALLAVLPVIFLAKGMEYYYVDFAIPGLAIAIGTVFEFVADAVPDRAQTVLAIGCLAVFAAVSFNTARVQQRAVLGTEATGTAQLIGQVRRENPDPSQGATIIVRGARPDAVKWLTAQGSLFRVIFHDPTLRFAFVDAKPESALPADLASRIAALRVAAPAADAGFATLKFVPGTEADVTGCSIRCQVLARQRHADLPGLPNGGWRAAYDSATTGDPSTLVVDHLVPLEEAWRSGADHWDHATREAFANDLASPELIAVTKPTAEARAAADPVTWKPSNRNDWCDYVSDWVTVKLRWGLTADQAEVDALRSMATTMQCS